MDVPRHSDLLKGETEGGEGGAEGARREEVLRGWCLQYRAQRAVLELLRLRTRSRRRYDENCCGRTEEDEEVRPDGDGAVGSRRRGGGRRARMWYGT
jgi:hypothetical protein